MKLTRDSIIAHKPNVDQLRHNYDETLDAQTLDALCDLALLGLENARLRSELDAALVTVRDASDVISRIGLRRLDFTAAELKAVSDTWLDRNNAIIALAQWRKG